MQQQPQHQQQQPQRDEPVRDVRITEAVHSAWIASSSKTPSSSSSIPLVPPDHPLSQLWMETRKQVIALNERRLKRKRIEESREITKRLELDELRFQAEQESQAQKAEKSKQSQAVEAEKAKVEAERNAARQAERERRSTMVKTVQINSDF